MERGHVLEPRHIDLVLLSTHRRSHVGQTLERRLLLRLGPTGIRMSHLGRIDLGLEIVRVSRKD